MIENRQRYPESNGLIEYDLYSSLMEANIFVNNKLKRKTYICTKIKKIITCDNKSFLEIHLKG